MEIGYFAVPGRFTELRPEHVALVRELQTDPLQLCRVAQRVLVAPPDAFGAGLSEERMAERNTRPASALLQRALELNASLHTHRTPAQRVVGTCRHYAVLSTAFLRAVNIPARARCGFASYFTPPKKVDHWITEYWSAADRRWIRVDSEYLDRGVGGQTSPADLQPGEFLTAGEAWALVRSGQDDPNNYGVFGTENWGPGEIRGNAMRDLASITHKLEMLPWDEWGLMTDSYYGTTGETFDRLIDDVAAAILEPEISDLDALYAQLAVPETLLN